MPHKPSHSKNDVPDSKSEKTPRDQASQVSIDPLRVVANLTHELKTPLHAILSTASILQSEIDGALSEEQKKQVGIVMRNGEHLLEMITSLLHYSATLTSSRTVHIQKLIVAKLLEEMVHEITPLATAREITLRLADDSSKVEIYSDKDLIKRIVSNILSNALKFTKAEGSVEVYIQDKLSGGVKIIIADTGVGMNPETKEKIFSAFYQADSSSTREFGGVGLGLSLVSNACAQIQAKIKVESELGSGSIFTIEIPDLKSQIEKSKILLVSEDPGLLQSLKLILENELHIVQSTALEQCAQVFDQIRPDLVIFDDYSPLSIDSIITKLKGQVIIDSALVALLNAKDPAKRMLFIDAGFKDILYKPFDAKELTAKINSILKYQIV